MDEIQQKFEKTITPIKEELKKTQRKSILLQNEEGELQEEILQTMRKLEQAKQNIIEQQKELENKQLQEDTIGQEVRRQEQVDQVNEYGIMKNSQFTIFISEAQNLISFDLVGSGDPYFVISFEGQAQKTSIAKSCKLAKYYQEFTFKVEKAQEEVQVTSYDHNSIKSDDLTGQGKINLWDYKDQESHSFILELKHPKAFDNKSKGKVNIRLQ